MFRRSTHVLFYSGMSKERETMLKRCSFTQGGFPRGRCQSTLDFESRIKVVTAAEAQAVQRDPARDIDVVPVRMHSAEVRAYYHLRQQCDAVRVPDERKIAVVEPELHRSPEADEAQIELITAYRNILLEAYLMRPMRNIFVPVLSIHLDRCGGKFFQRMPKMNQMSLIKSFHRVGENIGETFVQTGSELAIYMIVPVESIEHFRKVFRSEPWATPTQMYAAGRLDYYSTLRAPAQLQQYDAWTGKRPELIATASDADVTAEEDKVRRGKLLGGDVGPFGAYAQMEPPTEGIAVPGEALEKAQLESTAEPRKEE